MSQYLKNTRRYHLVILFAFMAMALWFTPVQHIITIGRFQHYALSILIFAAGYIAQCAFSWKELSRWGRGAYITTGLFFISVALVFYQNPWLDNRAAVPNEDKGETRTALMIAYMSVSVALAGIWLKLAYDEAMEKHKRPAQVNGSGSKSHS